MTAGVVVVVWNGEDHIEPCLRSILAQTPPPARLIVVDNASRDRSRELVLAMKPQADGLGLSLSHIEESWNTGFTRAANRGLRLLLGAGDVGAAVLVNQDAILDPGWWEASSRALQAEPRAAAVGSKLLLPNRLTVQHAGGFLEAPRLVGRHYGHHLKNSPSFDVAREVEYVTAAAMAMRLDAVRQVGLLDEVFSPGYYEDVDWCTRARAAGWKILYEPGAVATHVESSSFRLRPERLALSHRNRLIYALSCAANEAAWHEFLEAEREYIHGDSSPEERRALAMAYLWLLVVLPDVAAARFGDSPHPASLVSDTAERFADMRAELLMRG